MGKRAWCMKSFWSRQLSVCIIIILMMFLPFYFVNSKHTPQEQISDNTFSSFSRGVVNSLKVERNKYCCVTFSEIKQMAISPTTTAVFFILLCLGGRNVKRTLRCKSVRTPIVVFLLLWRWSHFWAQVYVISSPSPFYNISQKSVFSILSHVFLSCKLLHFSIFFLLHNFCERILHVKYEWLTS